MARRGRRAWRARVLLLAALLAVVVVAAMALVPGLNPRSAASAVVWAFGGVTCNDDRCPADAPWVVPVDAPVTSGFRTAARPSHHGVDMAAARGAPVVAASAGVVLTAECQARLEGEPYGCDRDGSAEVRGCGWYVKVLHASGTATLYCHLEQRPEVAVRDTVAAGDLLGHVGSSGNSSAAHLHFEVQRGGGFLSPPHSASAVDPREFLADRGVTLP